MSPLLYPRSNGWFLAQTPARRALYHPYPKWRYLLSPHKYTPREEDRTAMRRFFNARVSQFHAFCTCCKRHLCPASKRRQREANERATALELSNAESVFLYRLPLELVLGVLELLPIADVMSLRLSSRRFASLVQRVIKEKPAHLDKKDMRDRLDRDRYFKLAEAESGDIDTASGLLCSQCRQRHPLLDFDRRELPKSAHVRRCKGMTRAFRTCSHCTLTRDELVGPKTLRWTYDSTYPQLCPDCSSPPSVQWSWITKAVTFQNDYMLREVRSRDTVYRFEIQLGLRKLAVQVCPHMRTDDKDFQERLVSSPVGESCILFEDDWHGRYDNGKPINDKFAERYMDARMRICCREKHCESHIEIERLASTRRRKMPIFIWIRRNLGKMESPMDPVWLAQLEREVLW